jgi:hypothetical protein
MIERKTNSRINENVYEPYWYHISKQLFENVHIDISMFQIENHPIAQQVVLIPLHDHDDFRFDLLQHINYSFLQIEELKKQNIE